MTLALLAFASSSPATILTYEAVNLSGNSWRYDYEITNDTLAAPVDEFTIYFDFALYQNLRDATGPAGWSLLTAQPDPALPDDGFLDGLALFEPLGPGATRGVYSIIFDFLGAGIPGSQTFELIDSARFQVLDAGVTTLRASVPPVPVPEPAVLALLLAGLGAVGAQFARARSTH